MIACHQLRSCLTDSTASFAPLLSVDLSRGAAPSRQPLRQRVQSVVRSQKIACSNKSDAVWSQRASRSVCERLFSEVKSGSGAEGWGNCALGFLKGYKPSAAESIWEKVRLLLLSLHHLVSTELDLFPSTQPATEGMRTGVQSIWSIWSRGAAESVNISLERAPSQQVETLRGSRQHSGREAAALDDPSWHQWFGEEGKLRRVVSHTSQI